MAGEPVRRISPTEFRVARRGNSREINRQIALCDPRGGRDGHPHGPARGAPPAAAEQQSRSKARSVLAEAQPYADHPKRGKSGAIALVAQAEVLRSGARLATAAPEPMAAGEPQGPVAHTSRIKLQRFEPGDYELRVTVTDRSAGAMATRSVPFTVE